MVRGEGEVDCHAKVGMEHDIAEELPGLFAQEFTWLRG